MEKRSNNRARQNVIYLSENDAIALGIVEGETQSIFVDGKKVELEFVDEHEIFDMTPEEQRIIHNALALRKRELAHKLGAPDGNRTASLIPYGSIEDDTPNFDELQVSSRGKSLLGSIKSFFGKQHRPIEKQNKDIMGSKNYRNRTDIFTNEEIAIIQDVIARAQGQRYRANYSMNNNPVVEHTVATRKTQKSGNNKKKSKTKKTVSAKAQPTTKKKIKTLKVKYNNDNDLKRKAVEALNQRAVISERKKTARRNARRNNSKKK